MDRHINYSTLWRHWFGLVKSTLLWTNDLLTWPLLWPSSTGILQKVFMPIMRKWKHVFRRFRKCIENEIQKCSIYISIHTPLLWHFKLNSGASNILWSSMRCRYNLIGVHLWTIQLFGHDIERNTPAYIRSHSWQCMSEQKISHEIQWSVRRAQRLNCDEAYIWGRILNNF